MKDVRWREESGFEGKCEYCREWWPVDTEFWYPGKSVRMCRGCLQVYQRLKMAERRKDPAKRETDRAAVYDMRKALTQAGIMGEYRRAWYLSNRDKILRDRRERYARERAAAGKPYTPRVDGPDPHVLNVLRRRKAA